MKSINIYGICLLRKEKRGYIVYPGRIQAPISVLKKNIICLTERTNIQDFCKICTLPCQTHVNATCLIKTCNDPAVLTDILPQTVSLKTILKVEFWTDVLICDVPANT